VGSVPVGEYLFDPRAGNVSVNGQTLIEWYIEEYLFGPTGAGNPNISCKWSWTERVYCRASAAT